MSDHNDTPWYVNGHAVYMGADGGFSLRCCPNPEANARHIVHCVNNYDRLVEALKLSMLGLEAMIEDGRCGDTFTATALHLDKCNALLAQLETKGEE